MAVFAKKAAQKSKSGDIIALTGNLGAGKTFFAQNFINHFSRKEITVQSPTFNILKTYELGSTTINHLDFYRLESFEEVMEVGLEDITKNAITLIEWPKDFLNQLGIKPTMEINIEILDGERRSVTVKS